MKLDVDYSLVPAYHPGCNLSYRVSYCPGHQNSSLPPADMMGLLQLMLGLDTVPPINFGMLTLDIIATMRHAKSHESRGKFTCYDHVICFKMASSRAHGS